MKYDAFLSIDELKVSVEYETSQKKSMENRLLKYYLALNSLHETNPHHTMNGRIATMIAAFFKVSVFAPATASAPELP